MHKRMFSALALAALLALGVAGPASACPLCKEAVASQEDPAQLGGTPTTFMKYGYNWSVLFMMAMPFTLLGTGAWIVSRAVKQGQMPEW
jgi:hypothetical protein